MTTKTVTMANKMAPAIPPAIAPIFGEELLVGTAEELTGLITAASPTANVEKWVTVNEHMQTPFRKTAVQGDNTSGTEEGSLALASEIAYPCKELSHNAIQ